MIFCTNGNSLRYEWWPFTNAWIPIHSEFLSYLDNVVITAMKCYWSHMKIFVVPYTYGQTHPSTSGIGAALQSRASAAILQRLAQAIPKNCQVKRLLRFLSITCHRPVGGTGHPLIHYEFDLCLCLGSSTLAGPPARIMNASKRYLYYRAHFS